MAEPHGDWPYKNKKLRSPLPLFFVSEGRKGVRGTDCVSVESTKVKDVGLDRDSIERSKCEKIKKLSVVFGNVESK
jgi:hypothetical protein